MAKPMLRSGAVVVILAFHAVACAHVGQGVPVGQDPAAVRTAIEGVLGQFSAAMKRGDAAAVATLFTDDGQYITAATKGFVTGRAAIEEVFAARFKTTRFVEVTITTASVEVEGDTAYEIGTNRLVVQVGDAAPVTRTGRYLTVWVRQPDGGWRIREDAIVPDPSS